MCESTLLGLKGCSAVEPLTGLYIDDLGISQAMLGQFITGQYANGIELFEAKRGLAWRSMTGKLMTSIGQFIKPNSVIEGRRIGIISPNPAATQTAKGAGKWIGVKVKIEPNQSFLDYVVSDMQIYGQSGAIPIKVFNVVTGKLIDSFTLPAGTDVHYIGRTFKASRRPMEVAIVYESTFNTTKTIPKQGSCLSCGGSPKYSHHCPYVDSVGIELTLSGDTIATSTTSAYTNGISLNYNVNCDRTSWLCSIGGQLSMALAYATAVEIYEYALTISPSQRVNTSVQINRGQKPFATANAVEGIVAARDIAAQRFNEEYEAILKFMKLPDDNACFECRKNIRYATLIP